MLRYRASEELTPEFRYIALSDNKLWSLQDAPNPSKYFSEAVIRLILVRGLRLFQLKLKTVGCELVVHNFDKRLMPFIEGMDRAELLSEWKHVRAMADKLFPQSTDPVEMEGSQYWLKQFGPEKFHWHTER